MPRTLGTGGDPTPPAGISLPAVKPYDPFKKEPETLSRAPTMYGCMRPPPLPLISCCGHSTLAFHTVTSEVKRPFAGGSRVES